MDYYGQHPFGDHNAEPCRHRRGPGTQAVDLNLAHNSGLFDNHCLPVPVHVGGRHEFLLEPLRYQHKSVMHYLFKYYTVCQNKVPKQLHRFTAVGCSNLRTSGRKEHHRQDIKNRLSIRTKYHYNKPIGFSGVLNER
jgi:hypothetical protein